jgi:DNA-binding NarL/FixJ family response regulator
LPQDRPITVLCVDDHPIVREGLVSIINGDPDLRVVAEAETAKQAIAAFHDSKPDVTVIDLKLPDGDGIDVIGKIRQEFPRSRFVVLTSAEGDVDIRRALEAGAQAYLVKGVVRTELRQVIKTIYAGERHVPAEVAMKVAAHFSEPNVSTRELEVLQLVADGLRNKEIGAHLSISEETVKMHLRNVMEKLDVHDRTHAVMVAVRRGFLRP